MIIGISILVILIAVAYLFYTFKWYLAFLPAKKLVILMYHSVGDTSDKSLTVKASELDKQLKYLKDHGFTTVFFNELKHKFTRKTVILTFDDGYENNRIYLLPLLEKYGMKASIFLPTSLLEKDADKMNFETIRQLNTNHIELGLHSHRHLNYRSLALHEIEKDLKENIVALKKEQIKFSPVLAYPYGKYPREISDEFDHMLRQNGIEYGLRIGHKLNAFPFSNPYKICRIEILGSDDLATFKKRVKWGQLLFR